MLYSANVPWLPQVEKIKPSSGFLKFLHEADGNLLNVSSFSGSLAPTEI